MSGMVDFPGTPAHRALLRAVVDHYAEDPRVLAVAVFGSLGRGTWDDLSDLDLDVVLADGVRVGPRAEVDGIGAALTGMGERVLLLVPDGVDAADVVLRSLRGLWIRFHPLATTSPTIVDSLRVLAGPLARDEIGAAGLANRAPPELLPAHRLDQLVRWAVDVDVALQRGHAWQATQRMRENLLVLFAATYGGGRPFHAFDARATPDLAERLGATLHGPGLAAARAAFSRLLDLLEGDLVAVTDGRLRLSEPQREVLARVRGRRDRSHGNG